MAFHVKTWNAMRCTRLYACCFILEKCVRNKDNCCVLEVVCKERLFLATGKHKPGHECGLGCH